MSTEKPDLKVVESNPSSIFDDLEGLRKAQKLVVQRKAVLVNVAVDRPANNVHFRAHHEWALDDCTVLRDAEGSKRTWYFVAPLMRSHPKLQPRLQRVTLALVCIWPSHIVQLWPVPILGDRDFKVWRSAHRAYELSRAAWVQIVWNEEKADYDVETAEGINHLPVWPTDKSFEDLLKLGFDDKIIDNEDHPYVRRLRGLTD
jgi:hypothetical protein